MVLKLFDKQFVKKMNDLKSSLQQMIVLVPVPDIEYVQRNEATMIT